MSKAKLAARMAGNAVRQKQLKSRGATGEILGVSETARVLCVGAPTIRRWVAEGKLPCQITPSGYRIFSLTEVNALKQQRDQEALAD